MICPNLSKWYNPKGIEGLLFFAQSLEELLFNHTVDSYKAPATNLHSNFHEFFKLLRHHKENRIERGALDFCVLEILDRIKNNPVFSEAMPTILDLFKEKVKAKSYSIDYALSYSKLVLGDLNSKYWESLCSSIKKTIADPGKKKLISSLAIEFAVETEIRGYSRGYTYFETINFFFKGGTFPREIRSLEQIDAFLSKFNQKDRKWKFYYRGSSDFLKFSAFSEHFGITIHRGVPSDLHLPLKCKKALEVDATFSLVLETAEVEARDQYSARKFADEMLDFFSDICQFHDHITSPELSSVCVVFDVEKEMYFTLKPEPNPMDFLAREYSSDVEDSINKTIDIIKGKHFETRSVFAFIKALDFHRSALNSDVPEIQLINLWSAIEGFLPPPSKEGARIEHYLNILIPPLTLTYSEKLLRYMSESLRLGGGAVEAFVNSQNIESDFFGKSVALLVCDDFKEEREHLYAMLDHHPLLRYRCFNCLEKFKSSSSVKNTIREHKERIFLHIQRIYTLRNFIVHNAESLPYIRTLVANLHSYIDVLIKAITRLGIVSPHPISIYTAVELLKINDELYLKELEGPDIVCSSANYKKIIFGSANPISPYSS